MSLETAVQNGHLPIVKYLCSLGVDIQRQKNDLLSIASKARHLEICKYLYAEIGADLFKVDDDFRPTLNRYLEFCEKMKAKVRSKATKKIYYWWIPICYSLTHPSGCGKRMAQKNLEKFQLMCLES